MTGLQDRVFFDRDDVEALYARLPKARRLDLRDAGHLIPVERPQATIEALLDFGRWLGEGTKS
jgi:pimeloyl-ACP methyl ester carboxylesterase